jgi:hypothetical protein
MLKEKEEFNQFEYTFEKNNIRIVTNKANRHKIKIFKEIIEDLEKKEE